MKLVETAIAKPVTTAVGVILLVLFGAIALTRIPVQLTPTVEQPEISVITLWPGASPYEVEREIVDEQEEQLKSLEGLVRMESTSSDSNSNIVLSFLTGTDVDAAILKVSNSLEQVPQYPADAERPVLATVDSQNTAMAWYTVAPGGEQPFGGDIATLYDFLDDFVKPELERVPGVARANIFGGRVREMHVIVDPAKLAARRVTLNQLVTAIDRENRNTSGGDFNEGKRRYVVRTIGQYGSPEEIEDVVVAMRGGVPVYVRDVARAELSYRKSAGEVFYFDQPILALNAQRETGSNAIAVMAGLTEAIERLNRDLLRPRGLEIFESYDETDYIVSAIDLVQQNLVVGGSMAIAILLLFLRSRASTLIIAVAIPISVVGTFLMMLWLGRSLNVISLAGMAFAVGMVVDNSIVVLENIYRHRQAGKSRFAAASEGAREVWGAVLASTLTTIAVFLPVLFVQEEAGQLFRDIAIAISCAVGLSLAVAVTVIPSLSARMLDPARERPDKGSSKLWGGVSAAQRIAAWITATVHWLCGTTPRRLATVLGFTAVAVGLSWLLVPKAEYLPQGNQNFLFGAIIPPPGYNVDEVIDLQQPFLDKLSHLWLEESEDQPAGGIEMMFFIAIPEMSFVATSAREATRVRELIPEFQEINAGLPGAVAFITQLSLFQRGLGQGRNIDIDLMGPDLDVLLGLGTRVFESVGEVLPGAQAFPFPNLTLGNPELRVTPHRRRAAELGIQNRDLGLVVSALVDGVKASDYRHEGHEIDLKVMAEPGESHRTHLLAQMPIATPDGRLVTLGSIADVSLSSGPTQVRHLERQRAVTIQVTPPDDIALQEAMERVEAEILGPLRDAGELGGLYRARLAGSADKLTQTRQALQWNFLLAVIITYLLMAALFESFLYPFVILFSVPLAGLGGILGLAVLNLFSPQALDVLTMLGFIILLGTVVNNAILIVHQTLNHLRRDGMVPREAIRESVRTRVRPIFMSVMTSIFGMLPLVLFPGAGSELYRGLGSVVVGGLAVSAFFTLFLVPALLSLVLDARQAVARRGLAARAEPAAVAD
ncbi:MAG: efflux RND transporter permease subunit [bacterium]|nr:efflux RND transporter permease subunit [bacterium]